MSAFLSPSTAEASEEAGLSLEAFLRNLPGMAYRCSNDANWTMHFVSDGALELTGYPPEAFTRQARLHYAELIHPEDREQLRQAVETALLAGDRFQVTYRIVTADGQTKWVMEHGNAIHDASGTLLALQGFIADVTAMRKAEDAARYATQRFQHIARATNDTLWDWDFQKGTLWWSDGMQTLFGFAPVELESGPESWTNRLHPDDKQWVTDSIYRAIEGDSENWQAEYRFLRKDGHYAHVLDRGFVIRDDNGTAVRMVGGISDLTERRASEKRLENLNRALRILSTCNEWLVRADDEKELLSEICRVVVDIGGYQCAWVGFAADDEMKSIQYAASHGETIQSLAQLHISWAADGETGQGPTGTAIRTGQLIYVPDLGAEPSLVPWRANLRNRGYQSGLWLPLTYEGTTIGVLTIYQKHTAQIHQEELDLLEKLAANLAFGVGNQRAKAEKRRIRNATFAVAAGVSASTGARFFEKLAHHMAVATDAHGAIIVEFLADDLSRARTVSAVIDAVSIENFEYAIKGSPCESLLETTECVVLKDVATCFPQSGAAKMGMQTYIGCKLESSNGTPLGLLFVLYRDARIQPVYVVETIRIFASRAAAELERRVIDAHVHEQASLLDNARDAILVTDTAGYITYWNNGAERLCGWTIAQARKKPIHKWLYENANDAIQAMTEVMSLGQWQGEITCRRKDGQFIEAEVRSTLVRDDTGRPKSILSIITDVSQRKADAKLIHNLAFYDRLTGLPNRHFLIKKLAQMADAQTTSPVQAALLHIALANFRKLNDIRGPAVGDMLLSQVGKRLTSTVAASNTIACVGADEFAIVIDHLGDTYEQAVQRAREAAESILQTLYEPYALNDLVHHISARIGVAVFTKGTISPDDILKQANLALYEPKREGRDGVNVYTSQIATMATARVRLEVDLRNAVRLGEFCLHYQPKVDNTGRVFGVEALVRWQHPTRGFVSPAEFIPIAEECGVIVPLGHWVLAQACAQLAKWSEDDATSSLSIAVNVSAEQFRHTDFVSQVINTLERTGADASRLVLELTESLLVHDMDEAIAKMQVLRHLGVSFSLDDFGTGYSSLAYLKRLPLDSLKIDQSFVRDISIDPNDAAIVTTIIALARSLGLQVIAEGVETNAQCQFLQNHNCNAYQGYLFSKPLPIGELDEYILRAARQMHDRARAGLGLSCCVSD